MIQDRNPSIDRTPFDALYPFGANFLSINGLRYHYLDEGQGEPMVMVHGNPTWSFYFRRLVSEFRSTYRVIVPDHIGCGLSDKPDQTRYDYRLKSRVSDFGRLLDHLVPARPITLIVHDWGGMIGLAWALDHLDRVRRVVIMNTAGFLPPDGKSIPWRLKILRKPNWITDRLVLQLNLFARAALVMAPRRRLSSAVRKAMIAPYNTPRHRLATLKFVQDIPLTPLDPSGGIVARVSQHLDRLNTLPVQIIWGAHDFVFTRAYYDEWRRRLPKARSLWLANAGHYLLEDRPDRIVKTIRDFLRTT